MANQGMKQRRTKKIKKFTNRMSSRLLFVFSVVLIFMTVLIGRIVYLNHTDGVRYEKKSFHSRLTQVLRYLTREEAYLTEMVRY